MLAVEIIPQDKTSRQSIPVGKYFSSRLFQVFLRGFVIAG